MFEFLTALLGHPVLFVIVLLVMMGFMGMTYEFILRLFGKKSMKEWLPSSDSIPRWPDDLEDEPPPEQAKVPKPPAGPKDTLVAKADIEDGEEVEDDDENVKIHYIYKSDELAPNYWCEPNFTMTKDNKIKEGTH